MNILRPLATVVLTGLLAVGSALAANAAPQVNANAAVAAGTLTIVNHVPAGGGGTFVFTMNKTSLTGVTSVSLVGEAASGAIAFAPTNALNISASVPVGYNAPTILCTVDGIATGSVSGRNVTGVSIVAGSNTVCTYTSTGKAVNLKAAVAASPALLPSVAGGTVTYTYTVTNPNVTPLAITSLGDTALGTLAGSPTCKVGTVLASTASCSFTATKTYGPGSTTTVITNSFTATAASVAGVSATASASANVKYRNTILTATLALSPAIVPNTGGTVTGTFTVTNPSAEAITISSLSDGAPLGGSSTCRVGTVLASATSCSFTAPVSFGASSGYTTLSRTFTVQGTVSGATVTASSTASVTVLQPSGNVAITMSLSPSTIPASGGWTTVHYVFYNTRSESAQVVSTWDSLTGGSAVLPSCGAGTAIPAYGSCSGDWQIQLSGPAGGTFDLVMQAQLKTASGFYLGQGSATLKFV